MYIASFKITGLTGLLMHNPRGTMKAKPAGASAPKIPTPEQEALDGRYVNEDGTLFVLAEAFHKGLIKACSGRKFGKLSANTVIAGAVFLTAERCNLLDPKTGKQIKDYEIDIRPAVIGRARIMRARPLIPLWSCLIDFEIDADFIAKPDPILELMNIAGKVQGVGDNRPGKSKGPNGRYAVELVNNAVAVAAA